MKKIIIILTVAFSCIAASAQDNLKGSWSITQSVMGTTINDVLTFDSALSGNVENKASVILSANMMGAKLEGEIEMSITGTFEYKDGQLVIKWDRESIQQRIVRPIEYYYKGEPVPEMKAEMEKLMAAVLDDLKKTAIEEDNYESVTFKKGKLTLTERDEKGKKNSETYTFVTKRDKIG